jgi:hypothetical protein
MYPQYNNNKKIRKKKTRAVKVQQDISPLGVHI